MKKLYQRFTSNYILWGGAILAMFMLGCHTYQFINSGFRVEPLIRMVFCALYIPVTFFCGERVLPYLWAGLALVLVQFCEFHNYTYIFLLCLACMSIPKMKVPLLVLYGIDALVVCLMHDKSAMHYVIHMVNCGVVVFVTEVYHRMKFRNARLDLTDEERNLLEQLAVQGKRQKEIEGLKQNTVAKKLKHIREKNQCNSNDELYMKFRQEKSTVNP